MADLQHSTLTSSQVHEPKHITSSSTGDSGKVITPSGTSAGTSELRNLLESEISSKKDFIYATLTDVSTASSVYLVAPFNGTITAIYSVLQGAIATADSTVTTYIAGTAVTSSALTVAYSGSAAGDIDSATPSALNTFSEGQKITITTDGASTNTVALNLILVCTRTS